MKKITCVILFWFLQFLIFTLSQLHAKCIWESSQVGENFVFKGLDKVFVFEALNSDSAERTLKSTLSIAVKKKGEVRAIYGLETETINALGESKLFLNVFFSKTEDANINSLRIFASTGAEATHNHSHLLANVWEKTYLFENQKDLNQDISTAITKSIELFMNQYFQTNPTSEAIFYYPQTSGK